MENTNINTNNELPRLSVEFIDNALKDIKWGDIFSAEEHDKMRAEFCKKFDERWKANICVRSIAGNRDVSTSAVVTYVSAHKDALDQSNIKATILAIGSGKPKMSEEDKAFANLAKTLGMSIEDVKAKFGK